MNDLVVAVMGSVGGTAVIIGGLSAWLGRVWAGRILAQDQQRYREEIECIKKEYEVHFDGLKAVLMRYSESQFDIYRELWGSLCELKLSTDTLWTRATPGNVEKFSEQLNRTRFWLEKSSRFIEDRHYATLKGVFDEFEQFLIGKVSAAQLIAAWSLLRQRLQAQSGLAVDRWCRCGTWIRHCS